MEFIIKKIKNFFLRIFYSFKKESIKAIYEEDFLELLENEDLKENIENNYAVCVSCGQNLNLENIYAIKKTEDGFDLICSKQNCISKYSN